MATTCLFTCYLDNVLFVYMLPWSYVNNVHLVLPFYLVCGSHNKTQSPHLLHYVDVHIHIEVSHTFALVIILCNYANVTSKVCQQCCVYARANYLRHSYVISINRSHAHVKHHMYTQLCQITTRTPASQNTTM